MTNLTNTHKALFSIIVLMVTLMFGMLISMDKVEKAQQEPSSYTSAITSTDHITQAELDKNQRITGVYTGRSLDMAIDLMANGIVPEIGTIDNDGHEITLQEVKPQLDYEIYGR